MLKILTSIHYAEHWFRGIHMIITNNGNGEINRYKQKKNKKIDGAERSMAVFGVGRKRRPN